MKNTLRKLFAMSALLLSSSGAFATMRLELFNKSDKPLVANFSEAREGGATAEAMSESVNAGDREIVIVGKNWLNKDVTITWKDGETVVDTDTIHFKSEEELLTSSSNDAAGSDTLSH